jgi:hypothetical protein
MKKKRKRNLTCNDDMEKENCKNYDNDEKLNDFVILDADLSLSSFQFVKVIEEKKILSKKDEDFVYESDISSSH